ncbi:response regulator [Thalassoglobus polymorphus]|uniref:Transcriptional regulatory protein TdiR n=1 Tax=Thalassoglobus polymorphus TaxID=2527994 RepID=A0A517QTG0_9PLAN|nr:response regulator [Thalassoglobus polymorphus]QDT34924.1 Transcriptional regulatory protein TdiR [Thalassoglobus polymorphus]
MVAPIEIPNLLIADDDQAFRETVVEILEPHFPMVAVESGERAIEVVETIQVDVVILDMHMHVMTGLDTLRWLKERYRELPCILMSSDVSEELETQAYDLNAFRVLRKPPRRQHLIDIIHRAVKL